MTAAAVNTSRVSKTASYNRKILTEYLDASRRLPTMTSELLKIFSEGKVDVMERLASELGKTAPGHPDLPMIYGVIHELRRLAPAADRPRPGKGRRPEISLPLEEIPVADLERISGIQHCARKRHLIYTYREILGAARRHRLPEVLNRDSLRAFRKELSGRGLAESTISIKIRDAKALASLWGMDTETMALLTNENRAAKITADRAPSVLHAAFRSAPLTPLDYARLARSASEEAFGCKGNRQSIHRLFMTAATLALLSFLPERVGDILKLTIDRDVVREAEGWSSNYFSNKSGVDRSVECLPDQLTPYLDDLVLLGANPGPRGENLVRLYRHRADAKSPLFARTDLRRAYSSTRIFEWIKERTGHGPNAARKAMTDYLADIGGSRTEIMSLLGHRRASTSQQHYEVHAAANRRKRTTDRIDRLREDLAQSGELRLATGRLVDLGKIFRSLDRAVST